MSYTEAMVEKNFETHRPHEAAQKRMTEIRRETKALAHLIRTSVPVSAEQTLSLRKLEEALFYANAGIARNQDRICDTETDLATTSETPDNGKENAATT